MGMIQYYISTSFIGSDHALIHCYTAIQMGLIPHIDLIFILPKWAYKMPRDYHTFLIQKGIEVKRSECSN